MSGGVVVWRVVERDCVLCGVPAAQCLARPLTRSVVGCESEARFRRTGLPGTVPCIYCERPTKDLTAKQIGGYWCWVCRSDLDVCRKRFTERQDDHRREIDRRIRTGQRNGDTHLVVVLDPVSAELETGNFYLRVQPGQDPKAVVDEYLKGWHADADFMECTAIPITSEVA